MCNIFTFTELDVIRSIIQLASDIIAYLTVLLELYVMSRSKKEAASFLYCYDCVSDWISSGEVTKTHLNSKRHVLKLSLKLKRLSFHCCVLLFGCALRSSCVLFVSSYLCYFTEMKSLKNFYSYLWR